jgi:hypothetical protein
MADRVRVTEAVRLTGVPGTEIFLAIRHGAITSERDDRGFPLVDPDEVAALAVTADRRQLPPLSVVEDESDDRREPSHVWLAH